MLERTDAIRNEVLEPITFVLAHSTLFPVLRHDSVKACGRTEGGTPQRFNIGSKTEVSGSASRSGRFTLA
jgi:hypothetical protein